MIDAEARQEARRRGELLGLVYREHRAQRDMLDHLAVWGFLLDIGLGIGRNGTIALLQDLCDRDCLSFAQNRNKYTGDVEITLIKLLPKGRDLVERRIVDPAIYIP